MMKEQNESFPTALEDISSAARFSMLGHDPGIYLPSHELEN